MTTVRSAPETETSTNAEFGPGERVRRLQRRRRRLREEIAAVVVLIIALAATVAVLAMQWLASGPSTSSAAGASRPAFVIYATHGGPI